MSGGTTSQPVQTSSTTSSPWAGVQPYLGLMYSGASNLQQNPGAAGMPYQGPTMAPLDPSIQTSLAQLGIGGPAGGGGVWGNLSNNLIPGLQTGLTGLSQISQSQGITPQVQQALTGLGQAATQYGNIYQQAAGQQNPYLLASIADQNRRGNEAIQSSMSAAGRYGSGQYQDVMSRAQAEVADPLLMQDYEARQARALQATQGLGQTFGQAAGIQQQGIGQAMQGIGLMPQLGQAQYLPSQEQLAAGQYMQNYNQQILQGQIQEYNAQANYP